jgi:hypothetical protein
MKRRHLTRLLGMVAVLTATTVAVSGPVGAATRPPATSFPQSWCSFPKAPPCVVSVSRDGTPISSDDPDYVVSVSAGTSAGAHLVLWTVAAQSATVTDPHTSESYGSLPASDVGVPFTIKLDLGDQVVREMDQYASGFTSSTSPDGSGGTDITLSGAPVEMGPNAECTFPASGPVCPTTSYAKVVDLSGEISDFEQWNDATQWNDFTGMTATTNIEETYIPPTISGNPYQIIEELGNSHTLAGESTPFQGFYTITIPNAFLEDMGIDDPSTLDASSVSTSIGSGTVTVTPGPTSTEVDVTGITFSDRKLRIKRGVITPTKPSGLTTRRTSAHRATLRFHHAKPRGSKLTGYQARCTNKHLHPVTATGKHTTLHLKGLKAHTSYTCQVRAKSKAGKGHWSAKKTLKK